MIQERMKTLRLQAKLTQKEIAEKLGISTAFYGQWETGKRNPASKNLQKIADFYNVSTDYLLGNTDEKNASTFEQDLEKSLDSFHAFSGKKMTDNDREAIRDWLTEHFKDK
ncbi:helix-turn-helix transcriptional regulator [Pseudolactococcus yaeyamensis]